MLVGVVSVEHKLDNSMSLTLKDQLSTANASAGVKLKYDNKLNSLSNCDNNHNAVLDDDSGSCSTSTTDDSDDVDRSMRVTSSPAEIERLLRERLKRATDADINLEVFMPQTLLADIADDILRASQTEPLGLSGCTLHVNLHVRDSCVYKLGKVDFDPGAAVPTFELFLTLVEDKKYWHDLRDLMLSYLSRCLSDRVVYISPSYQLDKRKLYRSPSVSSG